MEPDSSVWDELEPAPIIAALLHQAGGEASFPLELLGTVLDGKEIALFLDDDKIMKIVLANEGEFSE